MAAMKCGSQPGHLTHPEPVVQPADECRAGFFVPATTWECVVNQDRSVLAEDVGEP